MPKKPSDVDVWLGRETPRVRRALESASRYFDVNDKLTVNTVEAVYARESSFGTMLGRRGVDGPSGHFKFEASTARRYRLSVSKENDQRFDIDRASSAAKAGKDPQSWRDVAKYLGPAGADPAKVKETQEYVEKVLLYEAEFALKSPANKNMKEKGVRRGEYRCTQGHWRTIDDRPVFICD